MQDLVNYKAKLLKPIKGYKTGTKLNACRFPAGFICLGFNSLYSPTADFIHYNAKEGIDFKLV